jgi:hypothetical protein
MSSQRNEFMLRDLECEENGHPFKSGYCKRCTTRLAPTRSSLLKSQRAHWTT